MATFVSMAELILPDNRDLYLADLEQMFERRYELFFERLGWCPDAVGVTRGYDKDAFDQDSTVYIIERMPGARDIVGFARLNPTTGPHMMRARFAHYCDYCSAPPIANDLWELSRLGYFTPRFGGDRSIWKEVRARMLTAITEYCLQVGIRRLEYVVRENVYTAIQRETWGAQPLGGRHAESQSEPAYVAGISGMTRNGLTQVRSLLHDPEETVLMYYGPVSSIQLRAAA